MSELAWVFGVALLVVASHSVGSEDGARSVAYDCEKVGAFTVRDVVYDCKRRGEK